MTKALELSAFMTVEGPIDALHSIEAPPKQRARRLALTSLSRGRPARLGCLEGRLLAVDAATRGGMRKGAAAAEVKRVSARLYLYVHL